jgi:hypothetical protein
MKKLFFLLLIISGLPAFAQVNVAVNWSPRVPSANSDTIFYNPAKKLTWPDFKGKPGSPSQAIAVTSSGLGYQASMRYKDGKTDIVIDVYCYFSKQNSWVRPGRQSNYALTHEQHHFDVTYIVTDLFIQKLRAAKFTRNNYGDVVEKIYTETCRELEKMQNEYDGQTKNGQLKNIQAEWNDKIEKRLDLTATASK